MSELATLARPYAEAVFKRAKESGSSQEWSDTLAFLSAIMQDESLAAIVNNPRVDQDRLTALLLDICQEQMNGEANNFLKLLIENGRLNIAPQIAELFEKYKAEDEGYVDVDVITAYALTKAEEQSFTTSLKKKLNKKVNINSSIDKSLIGGFLVKAGDSVIDGSISGQLQQLAKRI
ncbi:F-type H+-transporting ATPase subunit delta [Bathymodiolus platifrons methanotrophic gill symbiont]|uniref:F0F1 ATP synthase subunit delta n=1 Tax=Bathymodiolus platifrons methanotrophic gill symbiont TaxID=113268 RepID=UPI000B40C65D|nr:F0F1 ATP synthase subunit delta [Bathymodiolus platifrons methanotrophic gill symbiont]TXK97819.1 F0F1 ATP synthase subunit delta [Methylococcaceae bacterium CS4]TXL00388.1 F0F1 ATP synthase subunit delta [Methylococcaceae bacterium CS5]TXL02066.1 F0F1 ATP synthase subunit delta [Methylococcaceae bacterium HT1]TXL07518.1 F0F1 ATP synthase subunit delta [Methylococcaceae bacterium CS3]TXL08063.1 F0F1 ATP synthase subunit delta [Methylococcaceae bacterium CS1]TXL11220.1 F0F1 ATP synthase sub